MNPEAHFGSLLSAALPFALAASLAQGAAPTHPISRTAKDGPYALTLKVLPAEAFTGTHAAMVADSGAAPVVLSGPEHPNRHLVVFVRRNGKPVEHAAVTIQYRPASATNGSWTDLPVARMHVTGKSLATTHYGNNVALTAGAYSARVTVNGVGPVTFRFTLSS